MNEQIKIPDGWGEKIFGEVLLKFFDCRGKTPLKLGMNWGNGDILALSANNVEMGKINKSKEAYYGSEDLYNVWMNKGDLKKNDILMTMEAPLGNVTQIPDNKKYILSQRVVAIRTKKEILENYYAFFLKSEYFQKELKRNSTGTTALGISQKKLFPIKIFYPISIKEQEKIASLLQNVDENIEKTEQIIEKQKKIKTGLMDDLLTGKIRIKDGKKYLETNFDVVDGIKKPVDWEVKNFKEIATICYGKDQKEIEVKNGKYQILGTGGEIGRTDTPLYSKPSVLIGRKGTIDKPMYMEKPFWTVDTLFYTNIKNGYNEKWFYYFMKTVNFLRLNEATGVPSLNTKSINKIKVIAPTKNERNMIENILSKQDQVIEKEQEYLEKLKKLKAGLMDDLLTGRKRVKF